VSEWERRSLGEGKSKGDRANGRFLLDQWSGVPGVMDCSFLARWWNVTIIEGSKDVHRQSRCSIGQSYFGGPGSGILFCSAMAGW
jgi:hypothetical protein